MNFNKKITYFLVSILASAPSFASSEFFDSDFLAAISDATSGVSSAYVLDTKKKNQNKQIYQLQESCTKELHLILTDYLSVSRSLADIGRRSSVLKTWCDFDNRAYFFDQELGYFESAMFLNSDQVAGIASSLSLLSDTSGLRLAEKFGASAPTQQGLSLRKFAALLIASEVSNHLASSKNKNFSTYNLKDLSSASVLFSTIDELSKSKLSLTNKAGKLASIFEKPLFFIKSFSYDRGRLKQEVAESSAANSVLAGNEKIKDLIRDDARLALMADEVCGVNLNCKDAYETLLNKRHHVALRGLLDFSKFERFALSSKVRLSSSRPKLPCETDYAADVCYLAKAYTLLSKNLEDKSLNSGFYNELDFDSDFYKKDSNSYSGSTADRLSSIRTTFSLIAPLTSCKVSVSTRTHSTVSLTYC